MNRHIYATKLHPNGIKIKTWSVQRALDPLVVEVSYN